MKDEGEFFFILLTLEMTRTETATKPVKGKKTT
jgi:hypothetical protein